MQFVVKGCAKDNTLINVQHILYYCVAANVVIGIFTALCSVPCPQMSGHFAKTHTSYVKLDYRFNSLCVNYVRLKSYQVLAQLFCSSMCSYGIFVAVT